MAEANVKLRVDSGDAVRKLTNVNTAAIKLNRTVDATTKKTATATANIQRFGISFRSVIGPVVAITGAATLFNRSLSKFAKREADVKVLTSQLTRLGATSTQIEDLKKAADELGDATLFSQDDFIQSFNVLSSFRAIAVSSFTEVSEVAANIAQVMGTDVKSATVQLAKALEDPTRGLTALSRSGITFNESQTKTIKNLVKSGNLLDAQALILETVKGQYDDAARAAGTGFAGAVDLLSENTDDLTEALGKGLEPAAAAVTTGLAKLVEVVSQIPTPIGQTALAIGGATAAVYALKTANDLLIASKLGAFLTTQIGLFKFFGAQIYLTAAAAGVLKLALAALPFAVITLAVGTLIKTLNDAKTAQDRMNAAIDSGSKEMIESAIAIEEETLSVERNKAAKMSLLGINAKLLESQQRLSALRKALKTATSTTPEEEDIVKPPKPPGEDLAALAQRQIQSLKDQASLAAALNEEEKRRVQFNIDLRKIAENAKGFAEEDVHAQIAARIELEEKVNAAIAYNEALENTAKIEEKARKDREKAEEDARKARESDPGFQMQKQLEELLKTQNQVAFAATSIGDAFADAFGAVVTGAKTGQEALADMLKSIASDFLAMAKKIIAQQLAMILYGTIMKALGIGGGFNSAAASPGGSAGVAGIGGGGLGDVFGNTSLFGTFAEGGFVNKPTNALIGEGGESEYVVPASKMNEAMGRYARGARGAAVIPDGSGGDAGGEMSGSGGSIDVSYSVERINNVNYVTAAEFERGMNQAAKRGAELGRQGVYSDLVNKRSIRSRIGV